MDISLPGYTLQEQIGHGGSAEVHLGVDDETGQRVAIKIVRTNPATPSVEALRFLHGAELNAAIHHKNVAEVFAHGSCAAGAYQVAEFLPGGDLATRLQRGMHIQALLKVIKDVARALDHIHAQDIVHRDVKPENVLFRGNGAAVLTDFGIAEYVSEASDSTMTNNGTVIGTPEYMSPEQAAGRAIDGRSDVYSLGVVFYRMLTGELPYRADTAVSLGVKHLQDPIPRLPGYLSMFQGVVDQALAKRPDQRFASGAAFVAALDALRNLPSMPEVTIKTRPISTQEIMAVGGDLLSTQRDPVRAERRSAKLKKRQRVLSTTLTLVMLGGLSGALYWSYEQGYISQEVQTQLLSQLGIGEDPAVSNAWSEAQSLRQDPNQGLSAIVAGYRRVLALDPEHAGALAEVAGLAADWRQNINEALVQGNLELATTRLEEANAVFPNDLEWVQLNVRLQNRQRADRIMVSTEALLTSHGLSDLPSATAAIQSYQEVLRLAPEHAGARQALDELGSHYALLAENAARTGEVTAAINMLERATAANDALPQLAQVRELISQATTAQAAIDELLQQARRYRALDQLIVPPGENAAELYHRVLATDPDNVFAAQGLDEVTAQVTAGANELLAAGELGSVDMLVNQAAAAGLGPNVINDIRSQLDAQTSRLEDITINLRMAQQLMAQGYLTAPPDKNAVAYLREVQQLDPGNAEAGNLLRLCAERLASVAREAHEFGLQDTAERYLDLALTITPEVEEWVALRDSWETSERS